MKKPEFEYKIEGIHSEQRSDDESEILEQDMKTVESALNDIGRNSDGDGGWEAVGTFYVKNYVKNGVVKGKEYFILLKRQK